MQKSLINFWKKIKYPFFFCVLIALEMLLISKVYPLRSQDALFFCGNFMLVTCVSLIACLYYHLFKDSEKILYYSCVVVAVIAAVAQFWAVCTYAVDIPTDDEWDNLPEYSLSWIFKQHFEHRIIFTKFVVLLLYFLTGWDVKINIILNYFFYLSMIFILYAVIAKNLPKKFYLPLFYLPFFTGLNAENLLWSFQNNFHFMFGFGLLAVWFGFLKEQNTKNALLFLLFIFMSTYSQNFSFACGILSCYLLRIFFARKDQKKMLLICLCGFLICGSFLIGYERPDFGGIRLVFPWQKKFWLFMVNLFARGLSGISDTVNYYKANWFRLPDSFFVFKYAFLYFVTMLSGLSFLFIKHCNKENLWGVFAILAGVFSSLAAVSMTRPAWGIVMAPRHAELLLIALPVVLALFAIYKKNFFVQLLFVVQILLTVSGHIALINTANYEIDYEKKQKIVTCVANFYSERGLGQCLTMDNRSYGAQLLKAKELRLHFVENLQNNSPH